MNSPVPPQRGLNLDKFKPAPTVQRMTGTKAPAAIPAVVAKQRRVQSILANIEGLPSLPAVVIEVMQMANNPLSNATDFEASIRKDQALTAKMLKLVNSSFFGMPNKINSISRAVVVLGIKTLKSVVLAASTSKLLDRNLEVYGYARGGLWLHSLATAVIARHLALKAFKMNVDDAEELFVGGLLHDIGKIVISPILAENREEWQRFFTSNPKATLIEAENTVAGIDHCEAGAKLMSRWQLSPRLISILQHHHHCDNGNSPDSLFTNAIHLADLLCINIRLGLVSPYPWQREFSPEIMALLKMTPEQIQVYTLEVEKIIQEMQPVFESLRRA